MRAFVTGGTGFIGHRLVKHLLRKNQHVTAMVRSQHARVQSGVTSVYGSLEDDASELARHMTDHDVVYHLAALVSFDPRRRRELSQVNAHGTRTILRAAQIARVPKTVYVSSASTIGLSRAPDEILDETNPPDTRLAKRNPYLASKLEAEVHAIAAATVGQWVTIVNPTTVFGPGDRSLNSGTLVRKVAHSSVLPVPLGGSNVVDVDDVVRGVCAAAKNGRPGRRYVLGGENLRFSEIIDRIADVIGRRPIGMPVRPIMRGPMCIAAWIIQRLTGSNIITPQIVADTFDFKFYSSRRAEEELQWRARKDFTASLTGAWEYYQREGLITLASGASP